MAALWAQAKENLLFIGTCLLILAALWGISKLGEHLLPNKRKVSTARRVTISGICGAIAAVLHMLDFPVPFLAPGFYKLDFSELPVLLAGFYLGPTATVACEGIKILLKLLLKSTSTAFVGDFANFVVGCSLVLPATFVYHMGRKKKNALFGLIVGTLVLTIFGSAFNAVYLLPKFAQLYGMPMETILAAGAAIHPGIHSVSTFVLLAVAPLNLLKGISVSILALLLYKRVARPLFGKS